MRWRWSWLESLPVRTQVNKAKALNGNAQNPEIQTPPAPAGAQLRPIELLHQYAIGVVADHVVTPQIERALPRDRDRAAPERPAGHLVDRRVVRLAGVQVDDRAVFLAQQFSGKRVVVLDRVEQRA